MQQRIVALPRDAAAAGGDHRAGGGAEPTERFRFASAKILFPEAREDLRDRDSGFAFDLAVRLAQLAAQPFGKQSADCALAAARHADEDNILRVESKEPFNAVDLTVRNRPAEKLLGRALGLRHQHIQPVGAGETETLRLQQQRGTRGIVHHVRHGFTARKRREGTDRLAVVRIHAHRRGVDKKLGVIVTREVFVIVLSMAGDHGKRSDAQLLQHGAGHDGSAAAAENKRLFPRGVNAETAQQEPKAEGVGVVAEDAAVLAAEERVYAADPAGRIGELVAPGQDGLLVGDRDVQTVPDAVSDKVFQLIGGLFVQAVFIIRQLRVDIGRIAVAQLFTDETAFFHFFSSIRLTCRARLSAISFSNSSAASSARSVPHCARTEESFSFSREASSTPRPFAAL